MIDQFKGEYAFLSNFYPAPLEFKGILFPTVEHAFVISKIGINTYATDKFLLMTPGALKKFGRTVPMIDDWDIIKLDVMKSLLELKFQIPILRTYLLRTGDEVLVEGNWWGDKYWGVCLKTNEGENKLGELLMSTRQRCR